jgi:hypothetical protein
VSEARGTSPRATSRRTSPDRRNLSPTLFHTRASAAQNPCQGPLDRVLLELNGRPLTGNSGRPKKGLDIRARLSTVRHTTDPMSQPRVLPAGEL